MLRWESEREQRLDRVRRAHDRRADLIGYLDRAACIEAARELLRDDMTLANQLMASAYGMLPGCPVRVADVVARADAFLRDGQPPVDDYDQVRR